MHDITEVFGGQVMDNRVGLYVPSTQAGSLPLKRDTAEMFVNRSIRFLSEHFGGATAISAKGGWIDRSGHLVTEEVTLVYAFAGSLTSADLEQIKAYALELKADMGQEAIAVEINDMLLLI